MHFNPRSPILPYQPPPQPRQVRGTWLGLVILAVSALAILFIMLAFAIGVSARF